MIVRMSRIVKADDDMNDLIKYLQGLMFSDVESDWSAIVMQNI